MKTKYVLIYFIDDYPECGGGTHSDFFDTEKALHACAISHLTDDNKCKIVFAGEIKHTYKYEPIEVVKSYKPIKL